MRLRSIPFVAVLLVGCECGSGTGDSNQPVPVPDNGTTEDVIQIPDGEFSIIVEEVEKK